MFTMLRILRPDYLLQNLAQLSSTWLLGRGFHGLILDVDNTFVSRDEQLPSVVYVQWLQKLQACGIKVVLLSNNGGIRVMSIATTVGVPVQTWAGKPLPLCFKQAVMHLNLARDEVLVVGDQLFTDVLGAHWGGFKVALVKPLPGKDFILTSWMRKLENKVFQSWRQTDINDNWEEASL
jgi:HAD superfamily phosphatase (TIGR01668 family)